VRFTRVPFMYRDADNYKQFAEVDLVGEITDEQRAAIAGALDSGEYFIPEQIGITHLLDDSTWRMDDTVDHCWHELIVDEIEVLDTDAWPSAKPTRDLDEFVEAFTRAGREGWKVSDYGARFMGV
jgi:hypothetical protein